MDTAKALRLIDDQRYELETALKYAKNPRTQEELGRAISNNQSLEAMLRAEHRTLAEAR